MELFRFQENVSLFFLLSKYGESNAIPFDCNAIHEPKLSLPAIMRWLLYWGLFVCLHTHWALHKFSAIIIYSNPVQSLQSHFIWTNMTKLRDMKHVSFMNFRSLYTICAIVSFRFFFLFLYRFGCFALHSLSVSFHFIFPFFALEIELFYLLSYISGNSSTRYCLSSFVALRLCTVCIYRNNST